MEGSSGSGDRAQRKDPPSPFLPQMKSLDTYEEKEKRARRKKAQAWAMGTGE
jgi:hypothetical protein